MLFIPYSEVVNKYVHFCALGHKWKSFWKKSHTTIKGKCKNLKTTIKWTRIEKMDNVKYRQDIVGM